MNIVIFWDIIDKARKIAKSDIGKQSEIISIELSKLDIESIINFEKLMLKKVSESYRADLWDVCYIIACGCGDDGFAEFQGWLIAQGKNIFEKVLDNPQYLAKIVKRSNRHNIIDGRILSVAEDAYEILTGERKLLADYERPLILKGSVSDEVEFPRKYPETLAIFEECE